MVGSPTSNPHKQISSRWFIAVLALLALIATACGGGANDAASAAGEVDAVVENVVDSGADSDTDTDGNDVVEESSEAAEPVAAGESDDQTDGDVETAPDSATVTAEVLAFAIQAADDQSFTFEQGLALQIDLGGIALDVAPEGPIAVGSVDGANSVVQADAGAFISGIFESLGFNPSILGADFADDLSIGVWTVDNTMVIDMSGFAAGIAGLDPNAADELAFFSDGPVAVDLDELAELIGSDETDAASIIGQFGQGASISDPALVINALRTIDALTLIGEDTIGDTSVDVYEATVSMDEFFEAVDIDINDQLNSFDGFGVPAGPELDDTLEILEDLTVDMVISLGDDGLVRRLESSIDLGAAFGANEDVAELGLGDVDAIVDTWQTFDNYGEPQDITLPAAEDRTAEVAELLGN